jgi:lipopolysaccharide transport system ATP-binding protein
MSEPMAKIVLADSSVEFQVLGPNQQSIRNTILTSALGGFMARDSSQKLRIRALDKISLTIVKGERVGLMGDNGSGKSTLLRLLSGVYRPTSGDAQIDGTVATLIDLSLGINPEETGIQNIYLRARMLGIDKKLVAEKLDEIVEFSELGDFIRMPVRTYSSGMQLRLAMAVSTILVPQVLIMDEWLSVGDQSFKVKAEDRLREIVNECEILVIASHSRELLERVCGRGIVLAKGSVVFDGPIREAADLYFGPEAEEKS